MTNSIIVGVVVAVFLLAGADPFTVVYAWFSAVGTAGFIAILLLTSVAIVVFFARNRLGAGPWVSTVAPVLSIVAFAVIGYLTVSNYGLLSGGSVAGNLLLAAVPVFFLAGLVRGWTKPAIDYAVRGI